MAILSTNHLYNEPKRRSSKLLSEIKFPYNSLPMLDLRYTFANVIDQWTFRRGKVKIYV